MINSKFLKFKIESIFLSLLFFSLIIISNQLYAKDTSEIENYFNTGPSIKHLNNSSIEVNWNSYPEYNKTTHYQVMLNHAYYGHSTKLLKERCYQLTPGSSIDVRIATFHNGSFIGLSTYTSILMAPAAPNYFSIYNIATTSFSILWSGVDSATSYNIYNNEDIIASATEAGKNNRLTLTGFEPGSTLNISMTAINASGESTKSEIKKVYLTPVASLTINIPNSSITSNSFKIKWEAQSYASGYKILINDETIATLSADISEYDVTELEAGTSVSAKIAVLNESGEEASSDAIIVQLKPDAPILTVTNISSYSCVLTWSVANGANNYKIFENGDFAIYNVPSTITNVTVIEGVNAGSTVKYKVRGVNDIGESEDSNIVEVKYLPATSTSSSANSTASSIYINNRLYSESFNIPNAIFSKSLKENNIIAVYFPPELKTPELSLEVDYLKMLAETPELSKIRFYGIFTDEELNIEDLPNNLRFKKARKIDNLIIPGKIPVVRFYCEGGILRNEILISLPILTVNDVYKNLPEATEKKKDYLLLYHE